MSGGRQAAVVAAIRSTRHAGPTSNRSKPVIVRKLRLQQGWSQDQLATLSGLSVRTIQRLERGGSASLESAKALASVFEVDVSTF